MEQFKETLVLNRININYLNLDALYDYCGDDYIEFIKLFRQHLVVKAFRTKYEKNLVALILFYNSYIYTPHSLIYDKNKYAELSPTILNLSNRKIFTQALKYFLDDDVLFLNIDAIYEEVEYFFSECIYILKNDTHGFKRKIIKGDQSCMWDTCRSPPIIKIYLISKGNLMNYIFVWCSFMLAKITSTNVFFFIENQSRYIDVSSGEMYRLGWRHGGLYVREAIIKDIF